MLTRCVRSIGLGRGWCTQSQLVLEGGRELGSDVDCEREVVRLERQQRNNDELLELETGKRYTSTYREEFTANESSVNGRTS